jgi:hypothetical protein
MCLSSSAWHVRLHANRLTFARMHLLKKLLDCERVSHIRKGMTLWQLKLAWRHRRGDW